MRIKQTKRLGRPPDSTSDETRERLLHAARECFASYGFQKTTNRDIADAAGITTGAIYHYFDSKQELFKAVTAEVSEVVMQEFLGAVQGEERFAPRFAALLDSAARLHERDPSIAQFTVTSPIEMQRHPELGMPGDDGSQSIPRFFRSLVQEAVDRSELPESLEVDDMANMVLSLTLGLAYYTVLTGSTDGLRSAMRAAEELVALALSSGAAARHA
ncbi:MAG TPA: TetR/AcrR family transcriptional regulator [Acidimicrobiales bacterium]